MIPPHQITHLVRIFRQLRMIFVMVPLLVTAEEAKPPSAHFHEGVGAPVSNVNLPPTIPAAEGTMTVYADFEQANGGKVPIYIVNRTTERIALPSQDHDIFLKLERKQEDGHWERVQSHQYSWCGNSYITVELDPGSHFVLSGYLPTKGTKTKLRFRSYGSLPFVSNQGEGFFLEEDRLASGLDEMALHELPNSLQIYFRFDLIEPRRKLVAFSDERFLSALRLASSYRESRYVRKMAEAHLGTQNVTDVDKPHVAAALQDILGRKWPAQAETASLLKAALAELPDHPIPAWSVLNEFLQKEWLPIEVEGTPFEKIVAEEVKKALHRDNASEIGEVAPLIGSLRFAGEHFEDAFFEKWIRSPHDVLVQECANALSRRRKFDTLASIGSELEASAQVAILRALASGGHSESGTQRLRNPDSNIERLFWTSCANKYPTQSVSALYRIGLRGGGNQFNLFLHDPLRAFLMRETEEPSKVIEAWEIERVVEFVGAWKRDEDVALFRSLLEHPAYQQGEVIKSTHPGIRFEHRRYRVREEARRVLIGMGEVVPKDIFLEEERLIP